MKQIKPLECEFCETSDSTINMLHRKQKSHLFDKDENDSGKDGQNEAVSNIFSDDLIVFGEKHFPYLSYKSDAL